MDRRILLNLHIMAGSRLGIRRSCHHSNQSCRHTLLEELLQTHWGHNMRDSHCQKDRCKMCKVVVKDRSLRQERGFHCRSIHCLRDKVLVDQVPINSPQSNRSKTHDYHFRRLSMMNLTVYKSEGLSYRCHSSRHHNYILLRDHHSPTQEMRCYRMIDKYLPQLVLK